MNNINRLLLLIFVFSFSKIAVGAAFQRYEQGTFLIGTAGVGQSVVDDASSSYFNPANMSLVPDSELQLGSQLISNATHFKFKDTNTFSGGNSNNAGNLSADIGVFGVTKCSDTINLGFSLTSPFTQSIQYNRGWTGRYFVQSTMLSTYDVNLALSHRVNPYWSFGGSVFIEYAKLNQQIGIPQNDGQADFRLHSYRPGITFGVLFTPSGESTRIGIYYRSPVTHKLRGHSSFVQVAALPLTTNKLSLPQSFIASLSQDLTNDFTLLAEVGWFNWSSFKNTPIAIQGLNLPVQQHWKDTYRFGLGGQYILCQNYALQAGVSYDSSPCNRFNRLPDFPSDRQLRFGTGLIYTTVECVTFGLQYEFIDFGKSAIHQVTRIGTLSGDYDRNFANVLSLSVNFKF